MVDYEPLPVVVDPEAALAGERAPVPGARDERLREPSGRGAGRGAVRRLRRRRLGSSRQPAARGVPARVAWVRRDRRRRRADDACGSRRRRHTSTATSSGCSSGSATRACASSHRTSAAGSARRASASRRSSSRGSPATTGRPVRWTESRSENMIAMQHGRAAVLEFTIGGSRDGDVQAYRLRVVQDAGAYPGIGAILPGFTALMSSGVYAIPKIEADTVSVVTNTTPIGPFRGAGRPEATQAIERAMDLLRRRDRARPRRGAPAKPDRRRRVPVDHGVRAPATTAATTSGRSTSRSSTPATRRYARSRRDGVSRATAGARHRREHVRRDHERPGRAGARRRGDHAGRRGRAPHGLVLPRAGARDDVRDDRRRPARPPGRVGAGDQGRHRRRGPGHRHLRLEVDADRRGRRGAGGAGGRGSRP